MRVSSTPWAPSPPTPQPAMCCAEDESHWHHLLMTALTALAALMHDLGKATQAFQDRLKPWLGSVITIVMNGCRCACSRPLWAMTTTWVARLALAPMRTRKHRLSRGNGWIPKEAACCATALTSRRLENACLASLPPLAQAVAWLVLTHHRLPCKPVSQGSGSIGEDIDQPQYRWRRFGAHLRFVNAADCTGCCSESAPK